MERGMTHDEIAELLGAWALDAVDPDEAEIVARHLEVCPRCTQEVDGYREAAAALAFVGTSAPDSLWERIEARLEEEHPPALDMARITRRPGRAMPARWRRVGPRQAAAVAAVAVAAVVIGVLGVQVAHLRTQVRAVATRPQFEPSAGAVRMTLRSSDQLTVVPAVLAANGDGFVETGNLPALPPGKTYQLWAISGGRRISIGVLGNTFDVSTFSAHGKIDLLAITAEDAPGVERSTQDPVVVAAVPKNRA
jgi:hypothetical protein